MAKRKSAAIPAAPRKTLLEWIDLDDDGDTSSCTQPACSDQEQALHARILLAPGRPSDPIPPPPGLRLAPLG